MNRYPIALHERYRALAMYGAAAGAALILALRALPALHGPSGTMCLLWLGAVAFVGAVGGQLGSRLSQGYRHTARGVDADDRAAVRGVIGMACLTGVILGHYAGWTATDLAIAAACITVGGLAGPWVFDVLGAWGGYFGTLLGAVLFVGGLWSGTPRPIASAGEAVGVLVTCLVAALIGAVVIGPIERLTWIRRWLEGAREAARPDLDDLEDLQSEAEVRTWLNAFPDVDAEALSKIGLMNVLDGCGLFGDQKDHRQTQPYVWMLERLAAKHRGAAIKGRARLARATYSLCEGQLDGARQVLSEKGLGSLVGDAAVRTVNLWFLASEGAERMPDAAAFDGSRTAMSLVEAIGYGFQLVRVRVELGQPRQAVEILERLADFESKLDGPQRRMLQRDIALWRGICLDILGPWSSALENHRRAFQLQPDSYMLPALYGRLAVAHYRMTGPSVAIETLDMARTRTGLIPEAAGALRIWDLGGEESVGDHIVTEDTQAGTASGRRPEHLHHPYIRTRRRILGDIVNASTQSGIGGAWRHSLGALSLWFDAEFWTIWSPTLQSRHPMPLQQLFSDEARRKYLVPADLAAAGLLRLAKACAAEGDPLEAALLACHAAELAHSTDGALIEANAWAVNAEMMQILGSSGEAMVATMKAISLYGHLEDRRGVATLHLKLARGARAEGDWASWEREMSQTDALGDEMAPYRAIWTLHREKALRALESGDATEVQRRVDLLRSRWELSSKRWEQLANRTTLDRTRAMVLLSLEVAAGLVDREQEVGESIARLDVLLGDLKCEVLKGGTPGVRRVIVEECVAPAFYAACGRSEVAAATLEQLWRQMWSLTCGVDIPAESHSGHAKILMVSPRADQVRVCLWSQDGRVQESVLIEDVVGVTALLALLPQVADYALFRHHPDLWDQYLKRLGEWISTPYRCQQHGSLAISTLLQRWVDSGYGRPVWLVAGWMAHLPWEAAILPDGDSAFTRWGVRMGVPAAVMPNLDAVAGSRVLVVSNTASAESRGLQGAAREADEICRALPQSATMTAMLDTAKDDFGIPMATPARTVLHFCGHGTFDPWRPYASAIYLPDAVLSAGRIWEGAHTGLTAVVLPSCYTAAPTGGGPVVSLLGVGAAWVLSGARFVVASRWAYPDEVEGTSSWTTRFYAGLASNHQPDVAFEAAISSEADAADRFRISQLRCFVPI